ncbi:MAG: DUF1858 domain-containing protein [Clostridiaceae bacterium]|nr:DUF1858 domain-containing protein [Clostridiaceae bacterium]
MSKVIDLKKPVYELVKQYPEISGIMKSIGFEKISDPLMVNTVGRYMTIPKGAAIKKLNLDTVIKEFEAKGFTVIQGGTENE